MTSVVIEQAIPPQSIIEMINKKDGWHWDTIFTDYHPNSATGKLWTVKKVGSQNISFITTPRFKYGALDKIQFHASNFRFSEYLDQSKAKQSNAQQVNHSISILLGTGEAYDKLFEIYNKMAISAYVLYMLYMCNAQPADIKVIDNDDQLFKYILEHCNQQYRQHAENGITFIRTVFADTKQFEKLNYNSKDMMVPVACKCIEDNISIKAFYAFDQNTRPASDEHVAFIQSKLFSSMMTTHSKMFSSPSKNDPNVTRRIISAKLRTGTNNSKCFDICTLFQPNGPVRMTDSMWNMICQQGTSYDAVMLLQIGLPDATIMFSTSCKVLGIKITKKQVSSTITLDDCGEDAIDVLGPVEEVSTPPPMQNPAADIFSSMMKPVFN